MSFFGGPTKIQVMTDAQKGLLNQATGMVSQGLAQGVPQYGGQITPGATANQQAAYRGIGGLMNPSAMGNAGNAAVMRAMTGAAPYADPAARESYIQSSIENPARMAFDDSLRGIDARYGDRWSQDAGTHRAAVNDAAARFGTGLAQARANYVYADDQAAHQRALGGVGTMLAGDANQRANLGLGLMGGGDERAIEGQFRGEDYNSWLAAQDWANPYWGQFSSVMSAAPYAVGQKPGIGGALFGGIGSLLSGAGSFF